MQKSERIENLRKIVESAIAATGEELSVLASFSESFVRASKGTFQLNAWTPQDIHDLEVAMNLACDFATYSAYIREHGPVDDPEEVPHAPALILQEKEEIA